jgi:hypothetical protein
MVEKNGFDLFKFNERFSFKLVTGFDDFKIKIYTLINEEEK